MPFIFTHPSTYDFNILNQFKHLSNRSILYAPFADEDVKFNHT